MKFSIFYLSILLVQLAQASMTILHPQSLIDKFGATNGTIDVVYGNFGHIPYGQSVVGHMQYNGKNSLGCNSSIPFQPESEKVPTLSLEQQRKNVLQVVERGECTFVTKARNIARQGGSMAIVIDSFVENSTLIVMSDDGTGAGIRIPSILVNKKSGHVLLEYIKQNPQEDIKVMVSFVMPKKQDVVDIKIWYSPSDRKSM